jgi:hypothetical protein
MWGFLMAFLCKQLEMWYFLTAKGMRDNSSYLQSKSKILSMLMRDKAENVSLLREI